MGAVACQLCAGYSQGIAKSLEEICVDGEVVLSSLC